ncbi:MAG: ribosome biogenesis GTP-binding protein YihA/YsxC [Salinivirgaceae bacterium]|nr:ribosome biogenesis GTP-binding protein YihA/YsxC [Salinivirgaceae bacterium]MDD4746637.1 ribosome biogenesis GTP-binding protein YihA/YsxC [Salinivirgaceae bacterium]MDY0279775.1 ribosome biogenesis GTP-binding protein YihA/YsxC [Salinivirgaceae bacterium]
MIIRSADFVQSAPTVDTCPTDGRPEFAFIGRSNVGKSSLINMLTDRKDLAKTSQTPGKTQLLNHFIINDEWYLVDMPGYGYAKTGKALRKSWEVFIEDYILNRKTLINLFVLIDSRHEALKNDLEFISWLGQKNIPFSIVYTKIDKMSSSKLNKNLIAYKKKLHLEWDILPPIFTTSSEAIFGRDELLNYIENILDNLKIDK